MLSFFSVYSTCFTKSDKAISVNPLSEITRRVYKYHSQCYMDNTVSGTCMQVPNETESGDRRSKSPLCRLLACHIRCRCSMENSDNPIKGHAL